MAINQHQQSPSIGGQQSQGDDQANGQTYGERAVVDRYGSTVGEYLLHELRWTSLGPQYWTALWGLEPSEEEVSQELDIVRILTSKEKGKRIHGNFTRQEFP